MGISHSWNGTVLTITSDSGTSSADLKGDTGIRGPQGEAGISINKDVDLSVYYTKEETNLVVSAAIDNIEIPEVDLTNYATKDYVSEEVAKVASSGEIDLTGYATLNYVDTAINQIELTPGEKGEKGEDGYSPIYGVDYWTENDKAEIKAYVESAIEGGLW